MGFSRPIASPPPGPRGCCGHQPSLRLRREQTGSCSHGVPPRSPPPCPKLELLEDAQGISLAKGEGAGASNRSNRAFRALAAGFGDRKRKTNFSPLRPAVGKFGAGKLNAASCCSFSVSQHQNVSCTSSYLNLAKGRGRPRSDSTICRDREGGCHRWPGPSG